MSQNEQTRSFTFISILLVLIQGYDATETCFSCDDVTDTSVCFKSTKVCQPQEICYTSTTLNEFGVLHHSSGCISRQICHVSNHITTTDSPIILGNIIGRRSSSSCFKCCSNDSKLNFPCENHSCLLPDKLKILYIDQPSYVTKGSEVHLTCVVSGGNHPHITWIRPRDSLPLHAYTINDDMTLVITNFTDSESGEYLCVASDGQQFVNHAFNLTFTAGHSSQNPTTTLPLTTTISKTAPATIVGGGPPHIILIDIEPKIIHYGDNVTATCNVISNPKYDIINWDIQTSEIPPNMEAIPGNYSSQLRIYNFQRINEVHYRCSVKNSFGTDFRVLDILSSH